MKKEEQKVVDLEWTVFYSTAEQCLTIFIKSFNNWFLPSQLATPSLKDPLYLSFQFSNQEKVITEKIQYQNRNELLNQQFQILKSNSSSTELTINLILNNEIIGENKLNLLYIPQNQVVQLSFPLYYQEKPKSIFPNGQIRGKVHLRLKYTPIVNESEGSLDVYLIEAKDLPTTDESGLCDPFVILTVEPKTFQSQVIKEDCDPVFLESFHFRLYPNYPKPILEVLVQDWDQFSTQFLGRAVIELETIAPSVNGSEVNEWFPLYDEASTLKYLTERKEKFKKEQEEKERLKKEDEEKEKQLLKMILEQRSLHLENTVCTQSSVCSNDFSAFGPENALGGLDNFCQTEREFQPWWEIDLGAIYSIQLIRIFNREDEEWQKKLCNFWVLVSQVPFQLSTEPLRFLNLAAEISNWSKYQSKSAYVSVFRVPEILGRYIRIQGESQQVLSFSRIEVYGLPYSPLVEKEYVPVNFFSSQGALSKQLEENLSENQFDIWFLYSVLTFKFPSIFLVIWFLWGIYLWTTFHYFQNIFSILCLFLTIVFILWWIADLLEIRVANSNPKEAFDFISWFILRLQHDFYKSWIQESKDQPTVWALKFLFGWNIFIWIASKISLDNTLFLVGFMALCIPAFYYHYLYPMKKSK